jgi:hypothetical protein
MTKFITVKSSEDLKDKLFEDQAAPIVDEFFIYHRKLDAEGGVLQFEPSAIKLVTFLRVNIPENLVSVYQQAWLKEDGEARGVVAQIQSLIPFEEFGSKYPRIPAFKKEQFECNGPNSYLIIPDWIIQFK